MKKIKFLPVFLLAALVACTNEEENQSVNNLESQEGSYYRISSLKSSKHTISIEEAEENAKEAMSLLSSNGLKSASSKKVENVLVIKTPKSALKSANAVLPDTLAYVVNFADSMGFALVSADDRVPYPVLAYLDNGNYSSESDNINLNLMMGMSEQYIQNSIIDFEANKEGCLAYLDANGEPELPTNGLKASTPDKYGPYLTSKWGQRSPENLFCRCDNDNSTQAVAGCMPIALGQVMAYHRHASQSYNWKLINGTPVNSAQVLSRMLSIARLVSWIGKTIGTEYGVKESNTTLSFMSVGGGPYYSPEIQKLGYDNTFYEQYSWNKIKSHLKEGPVIMTGDRLKDNGQLSGHAWVSDGYVHVEINTTVVYSTPVGNKTAKVKVDQYFVHQNWGWDGNNNGYFAKDCFNAAKGSFDNSKIKNDQTNNYTKNLSFITLKPK